MLKTPEDRTRVLIKHRQYLYLLLILTFCETVAPVVLRAAAIAIVGNSDS